MYHIVTLLLFSVRPMFVAVCQFLVQ